MLYSSGPGPFPGVLDVSGFGGDVTAYRPAMFAAQGFVAFGVNYSIPGRQFTVDYFLVCDVFVRPQLVSVDGCTFSRSCAAVDQWIC